ncbi:S-4TM family putative pore-forming effector [uncultured Sphingomonas sp.]|uniref:S-4TM family putative pore-forming effector n=1 Tax=uncultured Sphingomonas sp. TaxID=158754 RepID=UPI0035CAD759
MNEIPDRQNSDRSIRLLRARKQVYAVAERFQVAQLLVVVALPIIAAVFGLAVPEYRAHVALLALIATLSDLLFLDRMQRNKLKLAAKLSEVFDHEVLELPWNEFVVGRRPDPETEIGAARRWRGGDDRLRDWYAPREIGLAPLHLARIICQRENLWYDSNLRRRTGYALVWIASGVGLMLLAAGIVASLSFADFVLTILVPGAPLIIWALRESFRQQDAADALDQIKTAAEQLWSTVVHGGTSPAELDARSREFQDAIYARRSSNPLPVPFIYSWVRGGMEIEMREGAAAHLAQIGVGTSVLR